MIQRGAFSLQLLCIEMIKKKKKKKRKMCCWLKSDYGIGHACQYEAGPLFQRLIKITYLPTSWIKYTRAKRLGSAVTSPSPFLPPPVREHTISRDNQRVNTLTLIPQIDQEIDRAWQWKTNIGFLYYGFNLIRWHFMNILPRHLSRSWKTWRRGAILAVPPPTVASISRFVLNQPTRR